MTWQVSTDAPPAQLTASTVTNSPSSAHMETGADVQSAAVFFHGAITLFIASVFALSTEKTAASIALVSARHVGASAPSCNE